MSKPTNRVLFVTYYFPPSGGPGVQRALKFVKYLPEFGWQPTVLTVRPEYASYPGLDAALNREIPLGVDVERTKAWDPYALYARWLGKSKSEAVGVAFIDENESGWKERLAKWIRANVFLPDARVGWVPFATRRGARLLEKRSFDVLFSTGPPQSVHLVARNLHRRFGVPWLADFRDPWTDISYYHELPLTNLARRIDLNLEKSVLEEASRILTVSPSLEKLLARKAAVPVSVIPNGYDEKDFRVEGPLESDKFVLAHIGNLAASQNPVQLWKALKIVREGGGLAGLRIRFVGNVDAVVWRSICENGLDEMSDRIPYVPHREAVKYMLEASLLLLCINRVPDSEGIVTGKIFEYIASGRPVLGIGPASGDAASILKRTSAGVMLDWDDFDGMKKYVEHAFACWEGGKPVTGASPQDARQYSRRNETEHLANVLDELAGGDPGITTENSNYTNPTYW